MQISVHLVVSLHYPALTKISYVLVCLPGTFAPILSHQGPGCITLSDCSCLLEMVIQLLLLYSSFDSQEMRLCI